MSSKSVLWKVSLDLQLYLERTSEFLKHFQNKYSITTQKTLEIAEIVTFTEDILNETIFFLRSEQNVCERMLL